jgi:hypothetical protein
MSTIVITVNVSQMDPEDMRAIRHAAKASIRGNGVRSSADTAPDADVPPLDLNDRAALKAFYEDHAALFVRKIHDSYIAQTAQQVESDSTFKSMKSEWIEATPEQREAARQALRS